MQPYENENSKVYLDENGIFCVEWREGVLLSVEDIQTVVDIYDEHHGGELWKVLHIFPRNTKVSSAARDHAEKREKPAKAEAFVIASTIQRNLFRFYRKFRSVEYPMKAFSDIETAKAWLISVGD